jgi:hypothetical protein
MLSFITGVLVGWLKELIALGIIFIEAIVLMLGYDSVVNYWDVYFKWTSFSLPTPDLPYWHSFGILLFAHGLGMVISKITPKFVSVNQTSNE